MRRSYGRAAVITGAIAPRAAGSVAGRGAFALPRQLHGRTNGRKSSCCQLAGAYGAAAAPNADGTRSRDDAGVCRLPNCRCCRADAIAIRGAGERRGGSSPLLWANGLARMARSLTGRRQPSYRGMSRTSRESKARICERLGARSPGLLGKGPRHWRLQGWTMSALKLSCATDIKLEVTCRNNFGRAPRNIVAARKAHAGRLSPSAFDRTWPTADTA